VVVAAPKDAREFQDLLFTALAQDRYPFVIRYPRDSVPDEQVVVDRKFDLIDVPKWEELEAGSNIVFLAVGTMVKECLAARDMLAIEGHGVGLVNARFTKPLDEKLLLELADRYDLLVTVEENSSIGGFGSAVCQFMTSKGFRTSKVDRLGIPDQFVGHAPRAKLLQKIGLSAEKIAERTLSRLRKDPSDRRMKGEVAFASA